MSSLNGSTELIIGVDVLKEFEEVISRDKFSFLDQSDVRAFLQLVRTVSEVVHPLEVEDVIIEDPDDDIILASAVEGRADFIITGDRHLLDLGNFRGIPIMTASSYLRSGQ